VREVRTQDFFSVLKPQRMHFSHVNQTQKQLGLLFGAADADLRTEDIPLPVLSPQPQTGAEKESHDVASAPIIPRSPIHGARRNREIGFKDHLNALFKLHDAVSKRMKEYEYVQLSVPIALASGYAVVSADGPGTRNLIFRDTGIGKKRKGIGNEIRSGQAMHVHCGAVVPDGADAVVKDRHVMKVRNSNKVTLIQTQGDRNPSVIISDLATPGQNIHCQDRPYYVGAGTYVPAKDYVHVRYPQALAEFEALFKLHFKEPVEPDHGQQQTSDTALKEEVVTEILMGIDSSPSKLLQGLKASERKRLAEGSRLQIIHARTTLVLEGDCEDNLEEGARSLWLLLSGEMGVYKQFEEDFDSEMGPDDESEVEDEDEHGKLLGTESRTGAIFGERQMLFGQPWPCSLKGITACKMAEIPLSVISPVILARPEALEGLEWVMLEEGFTATQNHSEMLEMIKGVSSPPSSPRRRRIFDSEEQEADDLKDMLQLHPKHVKDMARVEAERYLMESLIELGALNDEQIAAVRADPFLYPDETEEEKEEVKPRKHVERGAKGDSVTEIMSTSNNPPDSASAP